MDLPHIYTLLGVLVSLLGVYVSFRYFVYYRGLVASNAENQDRNQRLLWGAQAAILLSSLALAAALFIFYDLSRVPVAPRPTVTLTPPGEAEQSGAGFSQASPTPSPFAPLAPTPTLTLSPASEVAPAVRFARVGNTNTFGVNVRSGPGLGNEIVITLPDGSRVELLGEVQSADGFNWLNVRLEDGRQGWIADNFLIPEPGGS